MEDAETAANGSLVIGERAVSETETRIEIPVSRIGCHGVAKVRIERRNRRGHIRHVIELIVFIDGIGDKLPAQSHVQGELLRHLPIQLAIWREQRVAEIAVWI